MKAETPGKSGSRQPIPDFLNQIQVADLLGVSDRQVRNLEAKGLPWDETSGEKLYPKRACQAWYVRFKQEEALSRVERNTDADLSDAERRKAMAEARLAEIKVAREEGSVIPLDVHVSVVGELCDRLMAACTGVRGDFELDMEAAGVPPAEAERILDSITERLTLLLRNAAGELETDDEREGPGSDGD
jgi:hypothetical protein